MGAKLGTKIVEERSWKKLRNDELHDLYSSLNVVRLIKTRRMRAVEHVARMGEGTGLCRVFVGRPKGRDHWEDPGVGGRITLNRNLGR
jgi:hypothetical protein